MNIKVNDVYRVRSSWLTNKANAGISKLMPEFKPGALIKVLEVDSTFANATMISIDGGPAIDIEHSKISAYFWSFISMADINKGYLVKA